MNVFPQDHSPGVLDVNLLARARAQLQSSIQLKTTVFNGPYLEQLVTMALHIAEAIHRGGKLMLCGNGGSAADAQHLAAELLIRLRSSTNRSAIPALALALDTSTLTACGNDYGFDCIYERLVEGLGKPEDVLLGITTSGRSPNILRALTFARTKGIMTMGFLGGSGGEALGLCDFGIVIPSIDTNRIQETHIALGHILMDLIEHLYLMKQENEVATC